jgi:ribosomal protein L11 methyltransferase
LVYGESRPELQRLAGALKRPLRAFDAAATLSVKRAPDRASAWATEWTHDLTPVRISRSLTLLPTNWAGPVPGGGRALLLEPTMAFGFGEHPTTRLAARAVERACRARKRPAVLDVGTGSGILSIVAAASGAGRATGVDVDEGCIAAARHNAALNAFGGVCRFSLTPVARLRSRFDVVVANIDATTLIALAPVLVRSVRAGGELVLTGILAEQSAEVAGCYRSLGMQSGRSRREGEWTALTLHPNHGKRAGGSRRAKARRKSRTPRSR